MNIKTRKNNTSGTKGVYYHKKNNKWIAYITYKYKTINLGSFQNKEDAIKARKEAEEKHQGEYSFDNSRKEVKNE